MLRAHEDGVAWERCAVVVRRLDARRREIRAQFDALGVPFSAIDARGSISAAERRAADLTMAREIVEVS